MIAFTIQAAPLPSNFVGTPQQLFEAMLDRVEITSDAVTFNTSSTEPEEDLGPWLKNGTQIWVWSVDLGHYVPLDISASTEDEIFIGDISGTAPDSAKYQLWLKLDGTTVLGLFYYAGETLGWVQQDSVPDGSVTTVKLASLAVTTEKIKNRAVTVEKLADVLDLSGKTVILSPEVLTQIRNSGRYETASPQAVVEDGTYAKPIDELHNLGATPKYIRAALVAQSTAGITTAGYAPNDELPVEGFTLTSSGNDAPLFTVGCNSTKVWVIQNLHHGGGSPGAILHKKSDGTDYEFDPADWKIKIYASI